MTLKTSTRRRRHAAFLAAELDRPSIYAEAANRDLSAAYAGCAGDRRVARRAPARLRSGEVGRGDHDRLAG